MSTLEYDFLWRQEELVSDEEKIVLAQELNVPFEEGNYTVSERSKYF
jgi:hypothetical protein